MHTFLKRTEWADPYPVQAFDFADSLLLWWSNNTDELDFLNGGEVAATHCPNNIWRGRPVDQYLRWRTADAMIIICQFITIFIVSLIILIEYRI